MSAVDWTTIRAEYESGVSQRTLAAKYGISQAAISQRASKDAKKNDPWIIKPLITPARELITDNVENDELSPVEIVEKALAKLASFLQDDGLVTLNQHKLFADALSQYIKLKLTIPTELEQSPYDLRDLLNYCTSEEIAIIKPIMAAAAERKEEAEEKIKPLRRIS